MEVGKGCEHKLLAWSCVTRANLKANIQSTTFGQRELLLTKPTSQMVSVGDAAERAVHAYQIWAHTDAVSCDATI